DHLVAYRLVPNRKAVAFRLLARNLALGVQIAAAGALSAVLREPAAPDPPPVDRTHRLRRRLTRNCGIYVRSPRPAVGRGAEPPGPLRRVARHVLEGRQVQVQRVAEGVRLRPDLGEGEENGRIRLPGVAGVGVAHAAIGAGAGAHPSLA